MLKLAPQFFAQVGQPFQVFLGPANPVFRLPAPLLVLGDAGGFFNVDPKFLGLCLNQPGDHALLDDGVAARPQTGAEKQIGDVTAAALGTVQEIFRLAFPGHPAANGNLVEPDKLPRRRAIAVIEHQLNGRLAHRFACTGTVEDNVSHRLAAQVLGRAFAHHPAYRIDNVRFTTAVGADNGCHVGWEWHCRRIDKGFEAGQLDGFQAHIRRSLPAGGWSVPVAVDALRTPG